MQSEAYEEFVPVPRSARLEFPLELELPAGFKPATLATWPAVQGRLEFVKGRLWYMPPCGDDQQEVVSLVNWVLQDWAHRVDGFVIGTNEAGMILGGEVRGADVAVWRSTDLPARNTGGFRNVAPVLAVEVDGQDEGETVLLPKAKWYHRHGCAVVWLVFPRTRQVHVVTARSRRRFKLGDTLPPYAELPGLVARVESFSALTTRASSDSRCTTRRSRT